MDRKPDLLPGTLDMLILKTLSRGALHGYGIAASIKRTSDDVLTVEEGSLYPALYRLEDQGWIASEWGESENNRKAKYYSLTTEGRRELRAETKTWEAYAQAVAKVLSATSPPAEETA